MQSRGDTKQRQLEAQEAAFSRVFTDAVRAGTDGKLPIYRLHGRVRMVPVSEFLGECHSDAQALLLKACASAAAGDATMAAELLKSFTAEVASEYGVTTAEAAKLIADPDEDSDAYRAPVRLSREQCAAMDETAGVSA